MTAKYGKQSIGSEELLLPDTNSRKTFLPAKLRGLSTDDSPPSSHRFARKTKRPVRGNLPDNSGGTIATVGGRGSLSHISLGDISDPIDVDALPSLPHHQLVDRPASYYAPFPLQYRPSRPNVPPMGTMPDKTEILNGKVYGHQSHEIYKNYVGSKHISAQWGFAHPPGSDPFLHTRSAYNHGGAYSPPYAASLQRQFQGYPHDYRPHTNSYHTPLHSHPVFPVLDEKHLRQRAVQLVLDHSRPRTRKRRLSDDPDETSSSEYEETHEQSRKRTKISPLPERSTTPTQPSDGPMAGTPSTGSSEVNIFDRNSKLAELVEHTQLLTAMLMTYPRSEDQKKMREDVAMLATVTEKRLASWESAEAEFARDTRQRLSSAATPSPNVPGSPKRSLGKTKVAAGQGSMDGSIRKRRDDEVRRFLSTESEIWGEVGREKVTERDKSMESGEGTGSVVLGTSEAVAYHQDSAVSPAAN